jgi:hypothetical protein
VRDWDKSESRARFLPREATRDVWSDLADRSDPARAVALSAPRNQASLASQSSIAARTFQLELASVMPALCGSETQLTLTCTGRHPRVRPIYLKPHPSSNQDIQHQCWSNIANGRDDVPVHSTSARR